MIKAKVIAMIKECRLLNQDLRCLQSADQLDSMELAVQLNERFMSDHADVAHEDYACLLEEVMLLKDQLAMTVAA